MFADLLEQIPAYPRKVLEGQVSVITYGDLAMGGGWYENGRVSISPAIRHPRLFIERTMHECGHGIEEWLGQNEHDLHSCNLEQVADGFALSLLYPKILAEPGLKKIRKIYKGSLFADGFPSIDTERLIAHYVRGSEASMQENYLNRGAKISKLLRGLFEEQKDGFLRRHSANFVSSSEARRHSS
ncbi:hypothetical protein ACFL03_03120 [Thermodesulfobacteriota bacterium]